MPRSRLVWLGSLGLLAACDAGGIDEPAALPEILSAEVAPDTASVLRATVLVRTRNADSVAVSWRVSGSDRTETTPAVAVAGDSARVPVLGLFGVSRHSLEPVAWGANHQVSGSALELVTGPLPEDLPSFSAGGDNPFPGFVVFQSGSYGVVIDNTGRVVWYHRFATTPGLNFQVQSNGRYVARPPGGSGLWIEIDPMGQVTRSFGCAGGLGTRFHDLIVEPDGGYWAMCDDVRGVDLSALGGRSDASVTGTAVQHISASGVLLFSWTAFDHLNIADLDASERTGRAVNWTHGNALAIAPDGNLLLSLRNLSTVLKINSASGAVMWRLGGASGGLLLANGATPGFRWQHGLRVAGPGAIVLLNNLGDAAGSKAEWYVVDETSRTARLDRSVGTADGVKALQGGTTQLLPEGRVLVAYGNGNRVEEYDAEGRMVWRVLGNPGYVFRAERIKSLYRPATPLAR